MVIQPLTATHDQAQATIKAQVVTTALTQIMTKRLTRALALLTQTPTRAGLCGLHPFQKYLVQVSFVTLIPYLMRSQQASDRIIFLIFCLCKRKHNPNNLPSYKIGAATVAQSFISSLIVDRGHDS